MKLTLFFILFLSALHGEILELDNLKKIEPLINEQTLVIFDIDNTLSIPTNPAYQKANQKKYKEAYSHIQKRWGKTQYSLILNLVHLDLETKLVDPYSVQLIHHLQKRGIPVIALTAASPGCFGDIHNLQRRRDQLLFHKIDFSKAGKYSQHHVLDLNRFMGALPEAKQGIICTASNSKGKTFEAFLKKVGSRPQRVIFLDDKRPKVESLEAPMKKLGIEYFGIHYTAYQNIPGDPVDETTFIEEWEKLHQLSEALMSCPKSMMFEK